MQDTGAYESLSTVARKSMVGRGDGEGTLGLGMAALDRSVAII
jgi:hypothetical protein